MQTIKMKIAIVGSSHFCTEMVEYRDKLKALGHECELHEHYVARASGQMRELWDYIRYHYNEILNSDAVLVLNFDKNGIKNYIGGNTLIEMGQAYVNNKKIFLLNPIPDMQYKEEIEALQPVVISSNLDLIKI